MTVAQGTPRTEEALAKVIAYNERINAQSKLPGGVMINPADYPPDGWATARELERENAALSAQVVELQRLYNELLYGVARKCPDETRHQTALRYINNAETVHYGVAQANVPPSVKDSGT